MLERPEFAHSCQSSLIIGIFLECGSFYEDEDAYYAFSMDIEAEQLLALVSDKSKPIVMFSTYDSVIKGVRTVNQLIEQEAISENKIECQYPLKFSFDPSAVYEEMAASPSCPNQGFFYD